MKKLRALALALLEEDEELYYNYYAGRLHFSFVVLRFYSCVSHYSYGTGFPFWSVFQSCIVVLVVVVS